MWKFDLLLRKSIYVTLTLTIIRILVKKILRLFEHFGSLNLQVLSMALVITDLFLKGWIIVVLISDWGALLQSIFPLLNGCMQIQSNTGGRGLGLIHTVARQHEYSWPEPRFGFSEVCAVFLRLCGPSTGSGFLPQSKTILVRLISDSQLAMDVS